MSKKYLAVLLFLSTVILSGCTSILWALNNPNDNSRHSERVEAYSDEIQSAFEYKNVNLSTKSLSGATGSIELPSEGVGFIGKKNVYFVTQNGNALLSLNKLMKDIPLKAIGSSKYIDISLVSDYQGYGNAGFNQFIHVKTRQPASSLTVKERTQLTDASFRLKDGFYQRSVEIRGVIINKSRFGGAIPGEASLNDSYQVRFYRYTSSAGMDGGKLAFNVLMTPVTLTGDILLLPLYLLMMMNG
ncbi:hypothetical protein ACLLS5_004300 [Salmonella enterica]|uniref:Lipoprotein n=6 Tax=Salmonella enterica TaxID=28901 RepID=A0A379SAY8_SALER|nr:hypothetical protein [Salmonella enterica]AIP97736.1 hypothetical protein N898_12785 [Salmonella enterica subsp. arizonae serovar 62:z36:- str. RKS2983]ASO60666.1 hypothetical protein LFZ50_06780 [Salmonella enterica subsp. arizonae serovar 53:-:- str. SA20100345]AXC78304.1 hypothetical protein DOE56_18290 [Salmonella enterica subsp. arizonae serovar 63:g,z51:-]EAN8393087.1 hypothetical protein [Salmonella enterica subsp. arizonae serovar 13,23:gz51:-]EAO6001612.1 hypothetical protein [Salm